MSTSELSNSGLAWLAITIPLLSITIALITCRVVQRRGHLRIVDIGISVALAFAIAQEIVGCVGFLIWGLGHDADSLDTEETQKLSRYLYLSQIFYQVNIATSKISLLLIHLQIPIPSFTPTKPIYHLTTLLIIFSTFAFTTATIFQCTPVSSSWDNAIAKHHCVNTSILRLAHAATNIIFYILLYVLSVPIIRSLSLDRAQKLALACAYILAFISIFTTSILNLILVTLPISTSNQQLYTMKSTLFIPLIHSLESLLSIIFISLLALHIQITRLITSLCCIRPSISFPNPFTRNLTHANTTHPQLSTPHITQLPTSISLPLFRLSTLSTFSNLTPSKDQSSHSLPTSSFYSSISAPTPTTSPTPSSNSNQSFHTPTSASAPTSNPFNPLHPSFNRSLPPNNQTMIYVTILEDSRPAFH